MTQLFAAKGLFSTDARNGSQAIRDLPFRPRAVIAWWSRQDAEGTRSGNRGGLGFWADNGSASVAWASKEGDLRTETAQVADSAALLGLGASRLNVSMRADLESLDPGGFTVRWTTAPEEDWLVHFLALGGSVSDAAVGWFPFPERPQRQELDLSALDPDCILFTTAAVETNREPADGLAANIGVASRSGQAAAGYSLGHGVQAGTVVGAQRTDAAVLLTDEPAETTTVGSVRIRKARRPTIEWSQIGGRSGLGCYLALQGVHCKVATALAPPSPASVKTRVGFRPEALLVFSWGFPASSEPRGIGRLCIGGATPHSQGCAGWDDINEEGIAVNHVCSSSSDVIIVTDTQTGRVHAAATLEAINARGFTLDWRESDRPTREVVYLALAAMRSRGILGRRRR
jgi:hypothetical protein